MNYSPELKDALLRRMLPPNNESITKISREEGISEQTLRNWRDKARKEGYAAPGTDAVPDDWSTQDKFLVVVETASMNETELAEYARKKGLYIEQIKAWKDACMNANGGIAKEASGLTANLRILRKNAENLKRITAQGKGSCRSSCLTCTVKKQMRSGGFRGRMISASDRENAVLLINEAIKSGASCKKACERLGITERTFYRWKKRKADTDSYEDGRPHADHSNPANKIPAEIRREIINICNRPEYASMAPCEIVPALADEGIADCQGSCCRHE
ncbi:MAG: transposase [Fusicatenibacter saccharivorans]